MAKESKGLWLTIGNALSTILLGETKQQITAMSRDIEHVRKELDDDVKTGLASIRSDIREVRTGIQGVRNDVDVVRRDVDQLRSDVDAVEKELNAVMRPNLAQINTKLEFFWQDRSSVQKSPRQLNDHGERLLKYSGIKELVDAHFDELAERVREENPRNPYWLQRVAKDVVAELADDPNVLLQLEDGAYQAGEDVAMLLFVGSLYLRDRLLKNYVFPDSSDVVASGAGTGDAPTRATL